MNVNGIINHCLGLSRYELEDFIGRNYMVVYNFIDNLKGYSHTPNEVLLPVMFTCIATDGKFSEGEWNFVVSFMGRYSYEEARNEAEIHYADWAEDVVRKYVDMYPPEVSEAFVKMCIGVLCVDGRVDSYESTFLHKILN